MRVTLALLSQTAATKSIGALGTFERHLYSAGCALNAGALVCPSENDIYLQLQSLQAGSDAVVLLGYPASYSEVQAALSAFLCAENQHCEQYERSLYEFLEASGIKPAREHKKLCMLPPGTEVAELGGEIPAAAISSAYGSIFLLSDPNQLDALLPLLTGADAQKLSAAHLKLFGLPRAAVLDQLTDTIREYRRVADFFVYGSGLDVLLSVAPRAKPTDKLAAVLVDDLLSSINTLFARYIYAGEDVSLAQRLFELLKLRGKRISVAESLTGGMICSELIALPGMSEVFFEGITAYDNGSKTGRLSVSPATLKNYGAVSSECAYEMAAGLLAGGQCSIAISTTGIAGPSGATAKKPVGLTYIGVGTPEAIHVFEHVFSGGRSQVRRNAADAAMFYCVQKLLRGDMRLTNITIN